LKISWVLIIFTLIIAVALSLDTFSWLLSLTGLTSRFEEPLVSAYREIVDLEEAGLEEQDLEVYAPRLTDQDFHAGAVVLVYGNDSAFQEKTHLLLNYLIYLQINSISLTFPLYQDNWTASRVFIDDDLTLSEENIRYFIREAIKRNFTVTIRPVLDEASLYLDNHWRGSIEPEDIESWFQSYSEIILKYSQLAAEEEADIMCIGAEFNSLEAETDQWLKLIEEVRSLYSGQLTYSANWSQVPNGSIEFWSELDFIGIDAFFPLNAPLEATSAELVEAWQPWVEIIDDMKASHNMPVVFTEIGVIPYSGSYRNPWRWRTISQADLETLESGLEVSESDLETQRNYYAATCEAVDELVNGIYWWNFELDPPADPKNDPSFNPSGKPAADVIRNCFGNR
jgi:hypothetical protein